MSFGMIERVALFRRTLLLMLDIALHQTRASSSDTGVPGRHTPDFVLSSTY
jgi:hypothetical protein